MSYTSASSYLVYISFITAMIRVRGRIEGGKPYPYIGGCGHRRVRPSAQKKPAKHKTKKWQGNARQA